jgi:flavodoxin
MERIVILTLAIFCVVMNVNSQSQTRGGKILIVYFSHPLVNAENIDANTGASVQITDGKRVGNVALVADIIQKATGADIFQIQTQPPYSQTADTLFDYTKREQDENRRPRLASRIENIADYDTVFIGYPIWWYTIPMALHSFFDEYDFSGKTIIPFCVHGGSRWADSLDVLAELEPRAKILDGFIVSRNGVARSDRDVDSWLRRIGMVR